SGPQSLQERAPFVAERPSGPVVPVGTRRARCDEPRPPAPSSAVCWQSAEFQSDSHKTLPPFQTHGNSSSRFVRLRRAAPYNPGHPVGGEGVGSSALDDGGLWSSDEARAEESPGVLEDVDGWRPLARRAPWDGTATVETVSTFRLPAPPQGAVRDAGEAREGPPAGGASVQRPRGTARLVETVHTPTTGRARLSRTLPTLRGPRPRTPMTHVWRLQPYPSPF